MQFLKALFFMKKKGTIQSNIFWYLEKDYIIKTLEIFTFLPLINSLVTIGLSFLLLIISAIITSNTINTLHFLLGL